MKHNYLQLSTLWKKGYTLMLMLGLLLGGISTQAATDCNAVTEISSVECESLLELYHSTNGVEWTNNEGWNVTNTPCSWVGITCENGGVTEIGFYGNHLTGTIPNFTALPNLRQITLIFDEITGKIPNFDGLANLQMLWLSGKLTGEIPNFSSLPNLRVLILSFNQLTGSIPNFDALPNLKVLALSRNQLTGSIPNFNYLYNLEELSLDSNHLTGVIPTDLNKLVDLNSIDFKNNQLCKQADTDYSGWPIESIGLSSIYFSDEVTWTEQLEKFPFCEDIEGDNVITNCSVVTEISTAECEFLVEFYHKMGGENWKYNTWWNITNTPCNWYGIACENNSISTIILDGNHLNGQIFDFGALLNLQVFDLKNNEITGNLPDFSNLPNLNYFGIEGNNIEEAKLTTNCITVVGISQIECESLLQLYDGMDGTNWTNAEGWNIGINPCNWYGVTCENNGVIEIYLVDNNLVGTIPDFSGLPNLQKLVLYENYLTGSISNFSNLPNLQELYLGENQLTGTIPDFSYLSNLQILDLHSNQLTGNIPYFSGLPNLEELELGGNQLTGIIPDFSHLSNLYRLNLVYNQLTGKIPNFSNLLNSNYLNIEGNQLTTNCTTVTEISQIECESLLQLYEGTDGANWANNYGWNVNNTPCSWNGITCENNGVIQIYLVDNNLVGTIPDFSALPNLKKLYLKNNQLTGAIPNMSNLNDFSFSGNQLTPINTNCNAVAQISVVECESLLELYRNTNGAEWENNEGWNVTNTPCSWYGVTCDNSGVTVISLVGNQLTGTIPNFSALLNLQKLELSWNQLMGTIPNFSALPNLRKLSLGYNQLTGTIPNFNALPNLQELSLSENQLTGTIPNFSALPNLQGLWLYGNQLIGTIPNFSILPNLQTLWLYGNQLTGTIPNFSLPNLETLYIYKNQLMGTIPNFSALPNLQNLDLGNNQLTGAISNFSALSNLKKLYLDENQLTGAIPDFSALTELTYLDLRTYGSVI